MLIPIILFVLLLAILILAHEWGHFITAKKTGMIVEEFGLGLPPRAWGKKIKGTLYSINWLPLGGFVKILGEDGSHKTDTGSFASKPAGKRAIVLVAGVVMNIVLAYVIFAIGFATGFPAQLTPANIDSATDKRVQISYVLPDSPADEAGLEIGDTISAIDNIAMKNDQEVVDYIGGVAARQSSDAQTPATVDITIRRGADTQTIEVPIDPDTGKVGIQPIHTGLVRLPWYQALRLGASETVELLTLIVVGIYSVLKSLIVSGQVVGDVAGPVGIAKLSFRLTEMGFSHFLRFAGLLSLNLAVINILPFPALDGGRLLFLGIEKIKGSPISQRIEQGFHTAGFAILILLIILITVRDIIRL